MPDIFRSPNRYQVPPKDARAAINSQAYVTGSIVLRDTTLMTPPGAQVMPRRISPRDRRVALNALIWVSNGGIDFLTSATPAIPVGASYLPDKFPPKDRRVAIHSQQWVLTAAEVPLPRPPVPPPGQPTFPSLTALWQRDRRVSVQAQTWMTPASAPAIPAATPPPIGQQYYPDRIRPLSAFVAFYSQHWLNFPSRTQKAHVHGWGGTGRFSAVGTVSNRTVLGITGTGVFNAVSVSPTFAQFTMAGSGSWTTVGRGVAPAVAAMPATGVFQSTTTTIIRSVAAFTGSGVFNASGTTPTTQFRSVAFATRGAFQAQGAWSNNLPFNYPPSWSINIYGPIIEAVGYDPTTQNLKIIFSNSFGQFIIIGPFGISITNQIELSPNPEAYVLGLIR